MPFHTVSWTAVSSSEPLVCRSPQSFMALTAFAVVFKTSSDLLTLGFFSSTSKSRTALETTMEMTGARDSQIFPTAASKSLLDIEAELTTLAIVGCGEFFEAVLKAMQSFDHAGCASLQFAHFASSLSLF